jgi:hypothetical protein
MSILVVQESFNHVPNTGLLTDQATLHRVIAKIRDMKLPLISVYQVGSLQEDQHKLNSSCWEDHLLRDKIHLSEDQKLNRIVLQ